jgi:poly(A) polymerase
MNPPRVELDYAVRLVFAEHGLTVKRARFPVRLRDGETEDEERPAAAVTTAGDPPKKRRRRRRRKGPGDSNALAPEQSGDSE